MYALNAHGVRTYLTPDQAELVRPFIEAHADDIAAEFAVTFHEDD